VGTSESVGNFEKDVDVVVAIDPSIIFVLFFWKYCAKGVLLLLLLLLCVFDFSEIEIWRERERFCGVAIEREREREVRRWI